MTQAGQVRGSDGLVRCGWAVGQEYEQYHDTEWGVAVRGERALLERITLEAFQSGLSWMTILRKRDAFRAAFDQFDPDVVAAYDEQQVRRLLDDAQIVRNERKIRAAIANARATLALRAHGGLEKLFWSARPASHRTPLTLDQVPATTTESTVLAAALKAAGFRHVGPTTMYAAMQACGVVDDHVLGCHRSAREISSE